MQEENDSQFKIRFYRNEYPLQKQLVIKGQVINNEQNGCYVQLPEYEFKRGMIPLNQYSKSMRKAVRRVMKSGKQEVLRVIRVDKEKCYIDLSKKDVNEMDENLGQEKFAKAKTVNSILRHISEKTKIPIKDIYEEFAWGLYEGGNSHHPLDILKQILIYGDKINELGIKSEEIKPVLLAELQRRFKQSLLKTIAVIDLSVRSFNGITKLKEILKLGIAASKQHNYDAKIFIIGAPAYMIQVTTATKEEGRQAIELALTAIKEAVKKEKGSFEVKKEARVTGDTHALITDIYKQDQDQLQGSDEEDVDEDYE